MAAFTNAQPWPALVTMVWQQSLVPRVPTTASLSVRFAAVDLARVTEEARALGILVLDAEMVKDVTYGAHLTAPHAGSSDGSGLEEPINHIQAVDMLFDVGIPGEPRESRQ